VIPPAAPRRSVGEYLATIEATASVFFAFVIGLVVVVGGGTVAVLSHQEQGLTWIVPAGALVAAAEVASLAWLKWGLEGASGRDRVPALAWRQRTWPVVLRLPIACWWLAHAAFGVGAMWLLEGALGDHRESLWRSPLVIAAFAFGAFTITHTTHLFVMLGMTAVHRSERAVAFWWRHRFLIDALVVAVALLLPTGRGAKQAERAHATPAALTWAR
jgi:hypothetical protein